MGDLKQEISYGPMHFCRFGDCEIWVADGGDHRCVLHSEEPWAVAMRRAFRPQATSGMVLSHTTVDPALCPNPSCDCGYCPRNAGRLEWAGG